MPSSDEPTNRPFSVLVLISHDVPPVQGCYGGQAVTPNQDKLAHEGVRFAHHYAQYPLCGPSRANIFTGCRPLTTRRFNNRPFFPDFRTRAPEGFVSLPELFRRNGYRTLGAGLVMHDVDDEPSWDEPLWHPLNHNKAAERHPDLPKKLVSGDNKDWANDESYELIRKRWRQLQDQGYSETDLEDPSVARKAQGPAVEIGEVDDEGYYDGRVASKVIDHLRSVSEDQPFFIAGGFVTGHTPFRAPRRYFDLYDRSALKLPAFMNDPEGSPEWTSGDSEPAQYYTTHGYERPWRANREQSRELFHAHLAAASYIDAQIGRILDALDQAERREDTIVVVLSDHGFHDAHHGYWGKHNLWDRSLWVPLIMQIPDRLAAGPAPTADPTQNADPTRNAGRTIEELTEQVDLYPSLCDLCGLPKPAHLEGEGFAPLVSGRPGSTPAAVADDPAWTKRAVFSHRKHMWHDRLQVYEIAHTVRTRRYRYTEYLNDEGQALYRELFDYQTDPEERINHAQDPSYRSVVTDLRARLADFLTGST